MAAATSQFIVMTSIFPPTPAARAFAALPDWHLVVVGDLKSPPGWELPGATYLGPEQQRQMFGGLAEAIPWNHYARKNLGYLYALRQGAGVIAESDDDNVPLPHWGDAVLSPGARLRTVTAPPVVNIYRYFTDEPVWPRGLPLNLVLDGAPIEIEDRGAQDIRIVQYLVDGEPDVDAVYRLVVNRPVRFQAREPVVLDEGVFAPFNSQNTAWYPQAFPYMYLPAYVTFRFTDILRGWVAQRAVWEAGGRLAFGPATVRQERNAHDLLRDFESEIPCYLQSGPIIKALRELRVPREPLDAMRCIYGALCDMGCVRREEVELLDMWLGELRRR